MIARTMDQLPDQAMDCGRALEGSAFIASVADGCSQFRCQKLQLSHVNQRKTCVVLVKL
jgi:hypothetical protein